MKVKLLSAYDEPAPDFVPNWLRTHSLTHEHQLTEDPSEAEVIIFAETYASLDPYFMDVIQHPVYRLHRDRCVLYHYNDSPLTLCRTLSPSVEKKQPNIASRRSFHYIARRRDNYQLEVSARRNYSPKYLFSFIGATQTHPIRSKLLRLRHPESLLIDTSQVDADNLPAIQKQQFQNYFVESVLNSRFILCPRGHGPTSMRLFEAMQLGRVPVVVGDSWLPISGVDWDTCAIFVKESEIALIPEILESRRKLSQEMGATARLVWERRFSPREAFSELVTAAKSLVTVPYGTPETARAALPLLNPCHWRKLFGYWRRAQRKNLFG